MLPKQSNVALHQTSGCCCFSLLQFLDFTDKILGNKWKIVSYRPQYIKLVEAAQTTKRLTTTIQEIEKYINSSAQST